MKQTITVTGAKGEVLGGMSFQNNFQRGSQRAAYLIRKMTPFVASFSAAARVTVTRDVSDFEEKFLVANGKPSFVYEWPAKVAA